MRRYICIHGHFYQPPRENPWLEEVEIQDSAYPYHDWNERITAECYAPNTASRILDPEGVIINIVNNYCRMSFDVGPTLLQWMARHSRETYEAIIEADRISMDRLGHGGAIAQAYNHIIMPLANSRDKYTQVYWGIRDFEFRFGRPPEGMWLPETAVDTETLEIMASLGIRFTILSPQQALRFRKLGEKQWHDCSGGAIDPTRAYLVNLPSGDSITVFFYDGPISSEVAFGGLLKNGEEFAKRLTGAFKEDRNWAQLVHIATDGETYGHHHRGGDMALAYCLYYIENNHLAEITNYGAYLEAHPPEYEVQIIENSSWSCAHGVERWRDNCGCTTGAHPGWTQAWRAPLRQAMDALRDRLIEVFQEQAGLLLKQPWKARDEYIEVILNRDPAIVEQFLQRHALRPLFSEEKVRVLKLLEIQRHAMLMYTSCGWFFEEVSGIETVQVMMYAARAMQLARELAGVDLEDEFIQALAEAPSNVFSSGAEVYEKFVRPAMVDLERVGAHYAISSVFEDYPEEIEIYCYDACSETTELRESGRMKLRLGRARVSSRITLEEKPIFYAVLSLGDQNVTAAVREDLDGQFDEITEALVGAFDRGDIAEVIRTMDRCFNGSTYSLWHLFRDQQRRLLERLLESAFAEMDAFYRQIYENHYSIMNFLLSLDAPVPRSFHVAAEHTLNRQLKEVFEAEEIDFERLTTLLSEIKKWKVQVDRSRLALKVEERLNRLLSEVLNGPQRIETLKELTVLFKSVMELDLEMNLWKAQNLYFEISRVHYNGALEHAEEASEWVHLWEEIGQYLRVKPR